MVVVHKLNYKMSLDQKYEELLNILSKVDIVPIYGYVDTDEAIRVICDVQEMTIEEFVRLGKSYNKKIIILKSEFNFDKWFSSFSEIFSNENNLSTYTEFNKKIRFLSLFWINENVVYEYNLIAKWSEDIFDIEEAYETREENDSNETFHELDEVQISNREYLRNRLSEDDKEKVGKALAEKELFFKKRYDNNLMKKCINEIMEELELSNENLGFFEHRRIISKASEYFDKHLLATKEKELISQILEMKSNKISKVEMCSKLEITKGMLNKYYYKE